MLSFEFLLRLSAILKLDFLKSPGKSGSGRSPRGMKLGNERVEAGRDLSSSSSFLSFFSRRERILLAGKERGRRLC